MTAAERMIDDEKMEICTDGRCDGFVDPYFCEPCGDAADRDAESSGGVQDVPCARRSHGRPLFLPKGTLLAGQCHLTDYIAIGGKLSDIRYRMDDGSTLSVRTARLVGEGAGKNISGVYTGRWESRMIGATEVMTAKTMDGSLAAFWTEGEYAFSVVGRKMSDDVFNVLLSDVFVDMSEHFYGEAANPLARKTF